MDPKRGPLPARFYLSTCVIAWTYLAKLLCAKSRQALCQRQIFVMALRGLDPETKLRSLTY